jgi:hypothetical protein
MNTITTEILPESFSHFFASSPTVSTSQSNLDLWRSVILNVEAHLSYRAKPHSGTLCVGGKEKTIGSIARDKLDRVGELASLKWLLLDPCRWFMGSLVHPVKSVEATSRLRVTSEIRVAPMSLSLICRDANTVVSLGVAAQTRRH